MKEIWKPIQDSDGHYFISNLGRLKRNEYSFLDKKGRQVYRKSFVKNEGNYNKYNGYCYYCYRGCNGKTTKKSVHRLVATHFIKNKKPDIYDQINHIDGVKTNNKADNLEWCDQKLNMEHASEHDLINRVSEQRKTQAKINLKKAQEKVMKSYAKYDRNGNLIEIINGARCSDGCISIKRLTYKGYTYRSCEKLIEKHGKVPSKIDAERSFIAANKGRKKYVEHTVNNEIKEYIRLKDLPIDREFLWFAFNHDIPDTINGSTWNIVQVDFPLPSKRKYKTQSIFALDDKGNIKFTFLSIKEALKFLNIKGANEFYNSIKQKKKYKGYYWVKNTE